jgi:hypothetical protein
MKIVRPLTALASDLPVRRIGSAVAPNAIPQDNTNAVTIVDLLISTFFRSFRKFRASDAGQSCQKSGKYFLMH